MRRLVGATFLLLQITLTVYGRLVPSRFFSWAVFQDVMLYDIRAIVRGRLLTPTETFARYRLNESPVYENPAQDVIYIVRQYEQTYGRKDDARVELRYRVNGHETQEWKWPAQ